MKKKALLIIIAVTVLASPTAYAMHIAEGFLPPFWCAIYYALCMPFVYLGLRDIKKKAAGNKDIKLLLGLAAAYCLVLSALKLPSVAGSSSHPTGTGLGAILFGPFVMSVIGPLVLVFQALFLAHGGITTLGANGFSMAVAGPLVSYLVYKAFKNTNRRAAIFLAAFLGNIATYFVTSLQLALAFPSKTGGFMGALIKFTSIFGITQVPIAIMEGVMTVIIFKFIEKHLTSEFNILDEVV